jgi:hypothetical protein
VQPSRVREHAEGGCARLQPLVVRRDLVDEARTGRVAVRPRGSLLPWITLADAVLPRSIPPPVPLRYRLSAVPAAAGDSAAVGQDTRAAMVPTTAMAASTDATAGRPAAAPTHPATG